MAFQAAVVALEIVRSVRGVLEALRRRDGALADQARRAASSIALNVEEGNRREARDRRYLWRIAAGSAAAPLTLIDRELALLWRLCHPAGA